jgi:Icc-related predicted phosphoesterase
MLIDKLAEVKGLKIYGTPWVPIISYRWAFEAESDRLKQKFAAIPEGVDILLTHTPPRHDFLDVSLDYGIDSDKFGSSELADAIFVKKPKMCFCGHIHSGGHEMAKLCNTEVWNVSRVNESYEIAYDPLIVEL